MSLIVSRLVLVCLVWLSSPCQALEQPRRLEIERISIDLDGDSNPDTVLVYEVDSSDEARDLRCLEIVLTKSSSTLKNCHALLAQRGSTLAWHEYSAEPGALEFAHNSGTSDRSTEIERYVFDKRTRDFLLVGVTVDTYNVHQDVDSHRRCTFRPGHWHGRAFLSVLDREKLYQYLSSAELAQKACVTYERGRPQPSGVRRLRNTVGRC